MTKAAIRTLNWETTIPSTDCLPRHLRECVHVMWPVLCGTCSIFYFIRWKQVLEDLVLAVLVFVLHILFHYLVKRQSDWSVYSTAADRKWVPSNTCVASGLRKQWRTGKHPCQHTFNELLTSKHWAFIFNISWSKQTYHCGPVCCEVWKDAGVHSVKGYNCTQGKYFHYGDYCNSEAWRVKTKVKNKQ